MEENVAEQKNYKRGVKVAVADWFAGFMGGVAQVVVGQPLDIVKVRLQTQGAGKLQYSGISHCFWTIVKKETPLGLFKGMTLPLIGTSVNTILFGVHGNILRLFNKQTTTVQLLAGAAAGAAQTTVAIPVELAKIRMQMEGIGKKTIDETATYRGSVDAIRKVYRQEGFRGCYRGFTLTMIRDVPGFAVYFTTDDFLCRQFEQMRSKKEIGYGQILEWLVSGGLSGVASWIVSFAPDVMKTRFQADGVKGVKKYTNSLDVVRKSFRGEGAMVFTKGLGALLLRAFIVNGPLFVVVKLTLRTVEGNE